MEFLSVQKYRNPSVVASLLLIVAVDSKSFICVNLLILVNQC